MTDRNKKILELFSLNHPNAKCGLNFSSPFECIVAVSLSAQTTDKSVNLVTPTLFDVFPTPNDLAKAKQDDVEELIRSIGLYKNKARNLIEMSKKIVTDFSGNVPSKMNELTSLPGVGVKTASVVLAECFKIPSFPVDTHCQRVLIRLGVAKKGDSPIEVMEKAKKSFPKDNWINLHHQIIEHGRNVCHARNPKCESCPFASLCKAKASIQ